MEKSTLSRPEEKMRIPRKGGNFLRLIGEILFGFENV
jgi:hypothetical protein